MLALFENNRWINNFDYANKMAKLLEELLNEKGIKSYYPVESNMVFCVVNESTLDKMREKYDLKYWYKDKKVIRIATTFATTKEEIYELVSLI